MVFYMLLKDLSSFQTFLNDFRAIGEAAIAANSVKAESEIPDLRNIHSESRILDAQGCF